MEGERYASLDLDTKALAAALFSGAVIEEVIRFGNALYEKSPENYAFSSMIRMTEDVIRRGWNWVDCYEHGDELAELFREIIRLRLRGSPIASSEDLRLELVEITRESPTTLKILAIGTAASMFMLASTFSALAVVKQHGADACRADAYRMEESNMRDLKELSRREGKWTKEHTEAETKILAAMNTAIAACGSDFKGFSVDLDLKNWKVEFYTDNKALRDQPTQTTEGKRP